MLSQTDIELVQSSFSRAFRDKDNLSRKFYERLFVVAPKTKMLFKEEDLKKQRTMLFAVMAMVLKGLDDPDTLYPYLYMLGEDHAKMGVKPEYFQVFCEVFVETMQIADGKAKNEPLERAWRNAFSMINSVMEKATIDSGADFRQLRA